VPELWTPVVEGPHEAFVERLYHTIARFAETSGVQAPVVEVELADTASFVLDRIELRKAPQDRVARFGFSLPDV
jgi:hypothetical protein